MKACTLYGAKDLRLVDVEPAATLAPDQVRIAYESGGICGSDLHYYHEGRVGNFALKEPMILGHEIAGRVSEIGSAIEHVRVGQPVAIDPNLPCLTCPQCLAGQTNLCREMVFFGSAAVTPHIQGGYREELVVAGRQAVGLPDGFDTGIAAFAEPLSICLHAVNRAGPLAHRHVLVTGAGPIGCLTVMAAKLAGAARVTVTDVSQGVLDQVAALGADRTIDVATDSGPLEALQRDRGQVDVAFECSGNPSALTSCLEAVRPRGTIVQVGVMPPPSTAIPINRLMAKELALLGTFRFHDEFRAAVDVLVRGRLDVAPLLTGVYDFADADAAFEAARDRGRHMKVQLRFAS